MKFKSHLLGLKIISTLIFIVVIGLIIGIETHTIKINLSSLYILVISIILFLPIYIYSAIMNNDFILNNDEIIVSNKLLFFKKDQAIKFDKIQCIVFKDDTRINLISGYKWIKIKYRTNTQLLMVKKIHCNGVEYDAFDENIFFPTFDEFYNELEKRGLNVSWTSKRKN